MDLLRAIARPMLGSMFVVGGIDSLRRPDPKVPKAAPIVETIADTMGLPGETAAWVRFNGAVQVAAGTALALGKLPRVAALALAASLVPTTLAGHRFWEETDPRARANQRIHFCKNISIAGGLLLASVDTEGRPSLTWRAKHQAGRARNRATQLTHS